jgi:hypothetical protein
MARSVSYQVIHKPDGRFDIAVTLAGGRTHYREGLATESEVTEALDLLRDLMTACGAALIEEPLLRDAAQ